MFEINVNLAELDEVRRGIQPDLSILYHGLAEAAEFVRQTWVSAVTGNRLPSMTKAVNDDKYAASLVSGRSINFPAPFYAVVLPYGYAAEAGRIEDGREAYDMKEYLLNGPKAKQSKDGGRYNTIPFRHYTPSKPGAGSSAVSVRMRMPRDIYKQAKQLSRSLPNPKTGKVDWGQSLNTDKPPATSWTGYQHQSSIYQGMYRVGDAKNTQYLTFRRVSDKSNPASWWHPGTPPNPVIQAVYDYCMPIVEDKLMEVAQLAFASE